MYEGNTVLLGIENYINTFDRLVPFNVVSED